MTTEPLQGHVTAESPRVREYRSRAERLGLDFVNLLDEPADPALLQVPPVQQMLDEQWVPHRIVPGPGAAPDGGGRGTELTIAAADLPDERRLAAVGALFGAERVRVRITTDWDIEHSLLEGRADSMVADAADGLALHQPQFSAGAGWMRWQRWATAIVVVLVVAGGVISPRAGLVAALIALNLLFFVGVAFRVIVGFVGMARVHRGLRRPDAAEPGAGTTAPGTAAPGTAAPGTGTRLTDDDLPLYTILVPAFREANVIGKVVDHIAALDYPHSKLQVLLLLEASDQATIDAVRAARPPEWIRMVIVPPGGPQTKPKACNVGLAMARGEFLVIFDAEDRPEPDQLRSIVQQFRGADPSVACIQARLNYFNDRENILTRLFTLEYSHWFDYMLPGLDYLNLPILLGGTSNHFRVDRLRELGGWDPYNVTEDADLGMRASALGFTVEVSSSTTWEEACSQWRPWIRQRTRWIKGYMMTVLVHTRSPRRLWRSTGWKGVLCIVGLLAGTPAMFLSAPAVWALWVYTFLGGSLHGVHFPHAVQRAMVANFVFGNLGIVLTWATAAWRRRSSHLVGFALLAPLYWTLHSLAAWRALYHLIRRPSHWEKTPHGIDNTPANSAGAALPG